MTLWPALARSFDNIGSEQTCSDSVFFRSRVALALGFGGLLSIMGLAGIDALRVLQQFRRSDDQIRRRYLSENHVLNDIRSDVYVSGTYVRDYLLEPEPQRADAYRTNLEQVRKHMQAALDSYGRQVAPAEVTALYRAARRIGGLLGDFGADFSLGRRREAPLRILFSAG